MNYLQKKVNPPATTWKISNILTRNSSHWEYLNPMRNLKLLEKYQPPPPPPAIKKKKSQSTRKRKNITPCKSFNHPKIASTIMKKPQTPHLKSSQFLKKPYNSIGKIFNSFEVTRPIKPSPHEKISIPEKLTPFRKLQSCYIHVKIEINLRENIPPPPRNLSNPLNKLNTTEIIPTPPEKISNTSESISTPPKKFKPLPEKSQPH